jgi:O-glycosyl hydrolase
MRIQFLLAVPWVGAVVFGQSQISVDAGKRFQTIEGFGVNFNGTYFRDTQKPLLDMLVDDLGATIFRLDPYGLSNWEAVNDNSDAKVMNWEYYNDRYSIPAFEASWAAARYLNAKGILPFLTLSGIAPEWMLEKRAPRPGVKTPDVPDHLRADMYEEFAEEVVSLAVYARTRARIAYEFFSPLNETDCAPKEGPFITPDEMPLVLMAIARRLRTEGLGDVRLVVAEQCSLDNDFISPILARPELMKQVGAFSLHTYGSKPIAPHVEHVRASAYASVPVWLTEYGDLDDEDRSAANEWANFSVAATERALRALNDGATVALYWDAYDNYHEHYPRMTYYGLVKNTDHIYTPKKRYYAAKQLYRFVRPGFQRIGASVEGAGLTVSGFRNGADGSVVLVGVKRGGPDKVRVAVSGAVVGSWELYETTRQVNCLKADTSLKGEFEMPGDAIFTMVGKAGS